MLLGIQPDPKRRRPPSFHPLPHFLRLMPFLSRKPIIITIDLRLSLSFHDKIKLPPYLAAVYPLVPLPVHNSNKPLYPETRLLGQLAGRRVQDAGVVRVTRAAGDLPAKATVVAAAALNEEDLAGLLLSPAGGLVAVVW